jgi:hypothetical protein
VSIPSYGSSIKNSKKYRFYYMRYPVLLEGYNDAYWISETKVLKFTNEFIFTIGGVVVSWD